MCLLEKDVLAAVCNLLICTFGDARIIILSHGRCARTIGEIDEFCSPTARG